MSTSPAAYLRRWSVALLAALLLAACQSEADEGSPGGQAGGGGLSCAAQGGTVSRAPLSGQEICIRPTPDAGQSCTRKSDCAGFCLAETRSCAPVTPMFGCFGVLTEDGTEATLCVD